MRRFFYFRPPGIIIVPHLKETLPGRGEIFTESEISLVKKIIRQYRATSASLKADDFDDLFQICSLKLWQAKKRYRPLSIPALARITRNTLIDILRRHTTSRERINYCKESLDEIISYSGSETSLPEGNISDGRNIEKEVSGEINFERMMTKLTPDRRRICKLITEDYSLKEIANIVGKSERTIRREIRKIKETIRQE